MNTQIIARVELNNGWNVNFIHDVIDHQDFYGATVQHGSQKVGSSGMARDYEGGFKHFLSELAYFSKLN